MRQTLPLTAVMMSSLLTAEHYPVSFRHGLGSGLLSLLAAGGLFALTLAVALTGYLIADQRARTIAARQDRPRPRWQYLLLAIGCGAVAGGGAALASHNQDIWVAGPTALAAFWTAGAALVMLGRAACWGTVRQRLWWHQPHWMTVGTGCEEIQQA
jgi:hypothetical protein